MELQPRNSSENGDSDNKKNPTQLFPAMTALNNRLTVRWVILVYLFPTTTGGATSYIHSNTCLSYTRSVRKVSDLWPGKRNWLTWSVGHLITLNVVPLGLHTLLAAVPPLLEACRKSLFGMEFSSAVVAAIMSSLVWNRVPFNGLLSLRNSQKSQGAISGE